MFRILERFSMQKQLGDNLCWAANAASIADYYRKGGVWSSQCSIVNKLLKQQTCCPNPRSKPCDKPLRLDIALDLTRNLEREEEHLRSEDIVNEIEHGRVIAIRIDWGENMAHFVTIYGYEDKPEDIKVAVGDPQFGNRMHRLYDLFNNYLGKNGVFSVGYYTRSDQALNFTFLEHQIDFKIESEKVNFRAERRLQRSNDFSIPSLKDLNIAQHVYSVSFTVLLQKNRPRPKKIAFRVLGSVRNNASLLYEYKGTLKKPILMAIIADLDYRGDIDASMAVLQSSTDVLNSTYQLRLFRQVELGIEALWLYRKGQVPDEFLPIKDSEYLKKDQFYQQSLFFELLSEAALAKKKLYDESLK